MTKKELIEFLEPFSDETRIVWYDDEYIHIDYGYEDIHPGYVQAPRIPNMGIEKHEGIIVIN